MADETTRKQRPVVRVPEFDADHVRDVSEAVYRDRLGNDLDEMLEKDADGGKKLRDRAGSYDALTRSYLRALKGIPNAD